VSHAPKDLERLYHLLNGFETGLLTTLSPDGLMRTRPMTPQPHIPGVDLWLAVRRESAAVDDILAWPAVGLMYYRPTDRAYVSLSGEAEVVNDPERIRRFWRPSWRAWTACGPDDEGLLCIDVEVTHVEYTELEADRVQVLWSLLKARVWGEERPLGHVKAFDLPPSR
jgi:general stress protein 26